MIPYKVNEIENCSITLLLAGGGDGGLEDDLIGFFLANRESETAGFPMFLRLSGSVGSNFRPWPEPAAATFGGGCGILPAEEAEPLRCSDRDRCEYSIF